MPERETAAWEVGRIANVPVFSKLHIWNERHSRMLCGVAPNWTIANFGSSNIGECSRCFAIAEKS